MNCRCAFIWSAKTGGLTRVLERGRNGIETIVRMVILQLSPTIIELALIVAVLMWQFDWRYVVASSITVVVYMTYTYHATEWRIGIRRKMNESDTDANVKAIDSLLNYETVKYFSAEEREAGATTGLWLAMKMRACGPILRSLFLMPARQ